MSVIWKAFKEVTAKLCYGFTEHIYEISSYSVLVAHRYYTISRIFGIVLQHGLSLFRFIILLSELFPHILIQKSGDFPKDKEHIVYCDNACSYINSVHVYLPSM